jgi:hypothetical protein
MISLLQDIPVWLNVLVAIVGTVVCAVNLGRTRWAAVLAGGFFGETISIAFSRLAVMAVRNGMTTMGSVAAALFLASMIGLAARAAIVGGVAGLLSDLRNRTAA